MKTTRLALIALLPLLTLRPAPAEDKGLRLEACLPKDTLMAVLVEDAPTLIANWEKSPLAKTWEDPQVAKFFAPLREKMKLDTWDEECRKSTGHTVKELLSLFKGQAVFAITEFHMPAETQTPPPEASQEAPAHSATDPTKDVPVMGGVMLIQIGNAREDWEKLITNGLEDEKKAEEKQGRTCRETTEEFQGETLHIRQHTKGDKTVEPQGWAISKDMLAVAYSTNPSTWVKPVLQQAVSNLKKGGADSPLSTSPHFVKARARAPKSDLMIYVNLERLVAEGMKALGDKLPPNPMGLTAEGIEKGLGLDTLQAAFLGLSLAPANTDLSGGILTTGEKRGLMTLLAFSPGPCPRPAFVPQDAVSFGASRFSFKGFVDALEKMLTDMSPMIGAQLQMGEQMLIQKSGVDLKKDFFGKMGDEMDTAQTFRAASEPGKAPSADKTDNLFAVAVTDKQGFETALEGLKGMAAQGGDLFEKRDYLGTAIQTLKTPMPAQPGQDPQQVHYAITDRYLLVCVGNPAPLESALGALAKPGPSVWDLPEVKQATDVLPPGFCSLNYSDLRRQVAAAFETCCNMQETVGMTGADAHFCDPSAKPDLKTVSKFWAQGAGASYLESEGFFFRYRLIHPKPEKLEAP